jgi:hypothetical protein
MQVRLEHTCKTAFLVHTSHFSTVGTIIQKKKLRNVRIKFPNLFLQDFNLSSQQVDLLVNLCFTH